MSIRDTPGFTSDRTRVAGDGEPSKLCSGCKVFLTTENPTSFHKRSAADDGLQPYCIDCDRANAARHKARRAEMKESEVNPEVFVNRLQRGVKENIDDFVREKKIIQGVKKELAPVLKQAQKDLVITAKDGGSLVLRKHWPKDPIKRKASLKASLPQAIEECEGQLAAMGAALNIRLTEIVTVLETDEELKALHEQALNEAMARVEAGLYQSAISGNSNDRSIWLKANYPEKYGNKSQVTVNTTGFGAPPPGAKIESALTFAKEDEKSCAEH